MGDNNAPMCMCGHETIKHISAFLNKGSDLNLGQEVDACSFMFEAARLLHFHPEVLHIGENYILHCLAAT